MQFVLSQKTAWLAGVVALLGIEAFVVLVDQTSTFRTQGQSPYAISEFAEGKVVSHAFLMRGDGLHAVRVKLTSSDATRARLGWRLFAGQPDQPSELFLAFEGVASLDLRPGPQWQALSFTRNGSSNNRWFTLELQLLDTVADTSRPGSLPLRVELIATHDNPERGGALWVNNVRQTGSLLLDADTIGRTAYRRFKLEAEPHLPAPFRSGLAQVLAVLAFHCAFLVFAWAALSDAPRSPSCAARQ